MIKDFIEEASKSWDRYNGKHVVNIAIETMFTDGKLPLNGKKKTNG